MRYGRQKCAAYFLENVAKVHNFFDYQQFNVFLRKF